MSLKVISFTENGIRLSIKIAEEWDGEEIALFTKCTQCMEKRYAVAFVEQSLGEWTGEQMRKKNALLFIGACGIAVRAVAPYLTDKLCDGPVLVMDEQGKYVIPVLSGHMGGANLLAHRIAGKTGAIPVITTATDINEAFAVDLFAKRNGLHIVNKEGIAKVSAKVLAGETITMSVERSHMGSTRGKPEAMCIISYPPGQPVDIVVTGEEKRFEAAIFLKPREYVIGMGCKRGKETEKIEALIQRSMKECGILPEQLFALASIDRKKDEPGLVFWSRKAGVPFLTYPAEQLQEVEGNFHFSAFVENEVGVGNVCERAALKVCGPTGRLIYEKHAEDGMTIAIAKREWSVVFDEE